MVRSSPSRRLSRGSQPRMRFALVMSGWRTCGSSLVRKSLSAVPVLIAGDLVDQFGTRFARELAGVADIDRLDRVGIEQAVNTLDQVAHILERARLHAIAIERERFTTQRLSDEVEHHAPVAQAHTRPERVEDAHDAGLNTMIRCARTHRVIAGPCARHQIPVAWRTSSTSQIFHILDSLPHTFFIGAPYHAG